MWLFSVHLGDGLCHRRQRSHTVVTGSTATSATRGRVCTRHESHVSTRWVSSRIIFCSYNSSWGLGSESPHSAHISHHVFHSVIQYETLWWRVDFRTCSILGNGWEIARRSVCVRWMRCGNFLRKMLIITYSVWHCIPL